MKPSLAVLPVVGAGVAAAIALAAGASGQATSPTATTFKVLQTQTKFAFVDAPPLGGLRKPPTMGDVYVINGKDLVGGKPDGVSLLTCTVAIPGNAGSSECIGTATLKGGSISFQGKSDGESKIDTFAVVGGTGAYVGATGTLAGKDGGGNKEDITVTLK